jgi:hypothetical protein
MKSKLTDLQINILAKEFTLEPAIIKAVMSVESSGGGFNTDDTLKIKFEGHIFYKLLPTKNEVSLIPNNANICYPKWTEKHTTTQANEYVRLTKAMTINANAALMATSYGLFQIMGFNYKLAGYKSISEMRNAFNQSEQYQLAGFLRFISNRRIIDHLRNKRFDLFALAYNGKGYEKNKYDIKLKAAYEKWKQ